MIGHDSIHRRSLVARSILSGGLLAIARDMQPPSAGLVDVTAIGLPPCVLLHLHLPLHQLLTSILLKRQRLR
jgi:hypothetical protein